MQSEAENRFFYDVTVQFCERYIKEEVQQRVVEERSRGKEKHGQARTNKDAETLSASVPASDCPCPSSPTTLFLSSACLAANAALSLLNLACYFLDRQVARLAQDFENEGGFTERLYRVRTAKRRTKR